VQAHQRVTASKLMPYTTFLPSIHYAAAVTGEGEEDKARQIYDLMRTHPEQGRRGMVWDDRLAEIAYAKCRDQAERDWRGHVSPEGVGPNKMIRDAGYPLPDWYEHDRYANNCESTAHGGGGDVEGVWKAWMDSPGHRQHVLGLDDFYGGQTRVGVGMYAGGTWRFYWAILSVHPA
jgi:uncharacterized protein YkwD